MSKEKNYNQLLVRFREVRKPTSQRHCIFTETEISEMERLEVLIV